MKNTKMTEAEAMAENQSYILNRSKLFLVKLAVVMTLTVMVLAPGWAASYKRKCNTNGKFS